MRTAQRTAGYAALVGVCAALAGPAMRDGAFAGALALVCALVVPVWLGTLHQSIAVLVLATALAAIHGLRRPRATASLNA